MHLPLSPGSSRLLLPGHTSQVSGPNAPPVSPPLLGGPSVVLQPLRRVNDQAVTTPNARILEAAGSPFAGGPVILPSGARPPLLAPQATGALTSLRCTLRVPFPGRVRPFLGVCHRSGFSYAFKLRCLLTPGMGGRGRGELGREPWGLYSGLWD